MAPSSAPSVFDASKTALRSSQPGVYRDEPHRDDAASTSSAVLLEDIDSYPDEELPPYTDAPVASYSDSPLSAQLPDRYPGAEPRDSRFLSWYEPPPDLPFSNHDTSRSEFRTRFPSYSTDPTMLYNMVRSQADYAPSYFVDLHGTHTETRRNGNKETKDQIDDFFISINLTHLLKIRGAKGVIETLPDNVRGYRGGRIVGLQPSVRNDIEGSRSEDEELRAWCEQFCADKSGVKTFSLNRVVINHDTKKLEQLLRSAIQETNYRGHLSVAFRKQHESVVVYSPGFINNWRTTTWLRWIFYLTFLWIFTWPFLIAVTARYQVVKAIYPYANCKPGDDEWRVCTVLSEVDWFHHWQSAIRRAAMGRMICKDSCLDEDYRLATERVDRRGEEVGIRPEIPITGSPFADGALSLLGQGLRIAGNYNNAGEWGADC